MLGTFCWRGRWCRRRHRCRCCCASTGRWSPRRRRRHSRCVAAVDEAATPSGRIAPLRCCIPELRWGDLLQGLRWGRVRLLLGRHVLLGGRPVQDDSRGRCFVRCRDRGRRGTMSRSSRMDVLLRIRRGVLRGRGPPVRSICRLGAMPRRRLRESRREGRRNRR